MNLQPTLHGEKTSLRPLNPQDFEALYQAGSDPSIWELHPNWDRYKKENFQGYFQKAIESKGAFIILDKKTSETLGSSRYYDHSPETKTVKIGYTFLIRKCWGGSYNSEIKSLMLRHAFQNVDTVIFEVGESNLRSRKALEKIGAMYSHSYPLDGSPHCVYKIEKKNGGL